jgi:hypothetical protein
MFRAGFEPTIERFGLAKKASHGLNRWDILSALRKLGEFVIETHGNEIKTDETKTRRKMNGI